MLPPKDIYRLTMTVGEGMKMLISGGAVIPPYIANKLKEDRKKKPVPSKRRSTTAKKVVTDAKKNSKPSLSSRTAKSPPVSTD